MKRRSQINTNPDKNPFSNIAPSTFLASMQTIGAIKPVEEIIDFSTTIGSKNRAVDEDGNQKGFYKSDATSGSKFIKNELQNIVSRLETPEYITPVLQSSFHINNQM